MAAEKEEKLVKLPIILAECNKVVEVIINQEDVTKANEDKTFLQNLGNCALNQEVEEEKQQLEIKNESKLFLWPDAAVLMLIKLYREKENDFKNGMKRHNCIWSEIAAQLNKHNYNVTGVQCSMKFSGLKRTYKNIYEQSKKGGNSQSSWTFYSAVDTLLGEKICAEQPSTSKRKDQTPDSDEEVQSNSSKRRRVDSFLENFIISLRNEREARMKERKRREKEKKAKSDEKRKEREKMHQENMEIQKSILSVLQKLVNKKGKKV